MFDYLKILDKETLHFDPEGVMLMNIILAFIMFGVALEIKIDSFRQIITNPRSVIIGLVAQFVALPALTFILVWSLQLPPAAAMGLLLVAACPGGNISNFISSLAKGNTALSVSLTAIATVSSIFLTPLNFSFWGKLYIESSPLLRPIEIPVFQVFQTIFIILGLPLIAGLWFANRFPNITVKIMKVIKIASIFAFAGFVVGALAVNIHSFLRFIHLIVPIVFVHNLLALASGFTLSSIFKLPKIDIRSITIETGIQNSGLGLALIFNPKIFPPELELGGMIFIAAWWGVWHMITGLLIAWYWARKKT